VLSTRRNAERLAGNEPDGPAARFIANHRPGLEAQIVDGTLRLERSRGHELVRDVVEAFPGEVRSVTFGRPTLEDVFVHVTGRRFWEGNGGAQA